MEEKRQKKISKVQALRKASDYCAFQERCQQEVRDKLYTWGLHSDDVENLISLLITEGFINEERFAKAFAGGKFRIKKWGRNKITSELKRRNISEYCIRKAMQEIDGNDYFKSLKEIIDKKANEIKEKNVFKKAGRIASYCISRGYESDLVWEILRDKFEV